MVKKFLTWCFWKFYEFVVVPPMSREELNLILGKYGEDDDLKDVLRLLVASDKERYFKAPDEPNRLVIRGEIIRTSYLLRKIIGGAQVPSKKVGTRVAGRYGS